MKKKLVLIFSVLSNIVFSQNLSNNLLSNDEILYNIKGILKTKVTSGDSFNVSISLEEIDNLNFIIIPQLNFKDQSIFKDYSDFKKIINLNELDTLNQVFITNNKSPFNVIAQMILDGTEICLTSPLFGEEKLINFLDKKFGLQNVLVFNLPLFSELWILHNSEIYVYDNEKGKMRVAQEYLSKKYCKGDLVNLINGRVVLDNVDETIKVLHKMNE